MRENPVDDVAGGSWKGSPSSRSWLYYGIEHRRSHYAGQPFHRFPRRIFTERPYKFHSIASRQMKLQAGRGRATLYRAGITGRHRLTVTRLILRSTFGQPCPRIKLSDVVRDRPFVLLVVYRPVPDTFWYVLLCAMGRTIFTQLILCYVRTVNVVQGGKKSPWLPQMNSTSSIWWKCVP